MANPSPFIQPSSDIKEGSELARRLDIESLLSDARYDILAFSDVAELSDAQRAAAADCMNRALLAFFKDIGFEFRPAPEDSELRRNLFAWGRSTFAKACEEGWPEAEQILDFTAAIIEAFFPLAGPDSRLQLAVTMAVANHAEKYGEKAAFAKSLSHFALSLLLQKDTNTEDWQIMYSDILKGFVEHFGANDPRIGTFGAINMVQFIESAFTEQRFSQELPPHFSRVTPRMKNQGGSDGFPYFLRMATGVPAPFIVGIMKPSRDDEVPYDYWITSVVNLITFVNLGNDLVSWPKEVRRGETNNYMSFQTHSRQQAGVSSQFQPGSEWTFRDTLCEIMKILQTAVNDLDKEFIHFANTCSEEERVTWNADYASRAWLGFKQGYITWHLQQSKYGLDRLREAISSGLGEAGL
ncbi:hypothetical protein F4810DRAFT_652647 [Camillea tinctor]|nr:hypothetical protein F4810DRAFT_652647 [Camillea tinctor]